VVTLAGLDSHVAGSASGYGEIISIVYPCAEPLDEAAGFPTPPAIVVSTHHLADSPLEKLGYLISVILLSASSNWGSYFSKLSEVVVAVAV
jgi:hypothetical protein